MDKEIDPLEFDEPLEMDLAFNGHKLTFNTFFEFKNWAENEISIWRDITQKLHTHNSQTHLCDIHNITSKLDSGISTLENLIRTTNNTDKELIKTTLHKIYGRCEFINWNSKLAQKHLGRFTSIQNLTLIIGLLSGFLNAYIKIDNEKKEDEFKRYQKEGAEFRAEQIDEFVSTNAVRIASDRIEKSLIKKTKESIDVIDSHAKNLSVGIVTEQAGKGWEDKAKAFRIKQYTCVGYMFITTIVSLFLYATLVYDFMSFIKDIEQITKGHPEIILIPITAITTIILFLLLKIFANSYTGYQNLANDADQRVAIFDTYIQLIKEPGTITDNAREILLKEVLTRSTSPICHEIKHPLEECLDEKNLSRITESIIKIKAAK
jgi:hypothetical protein